MSPMSSMSTPSSEPPPRRRGRPGHDPETVVRRAVELFNRQGYDATSMSDLARELGFTKSAIYHHVPGKEHLLSRALDAALDELEAVMAQAARPGPDAYARLRTAVEQSVQVLVTHLPEVTLLLRVRGNSAVEVEALRRRRDIDDQLAGLVRAAVEEGSIRGDLGPELTSRLLFGMVNSLVEWYQPRSDDDAAMLAQTITTLAFDGLARRDG